MNLISFSPSFLIPFVCLFLRLMLSLSQLRSACQRSSAYELEAVLSNNASATYHSKRKQLTVWCKCLVPYLEVFLHFQARTHCLKNRLLISIMHYISTIEGFRAPKAITDKGMLCFGTTKLKLTFKNDRCRNNGVWTSSIFGREFEQR